MVGDPGIEPGVRLREGVTVPCHTLRPVAHGPDKDCAGREGVITSAPMGRQPQISPVAGGYIMHGPEGGIR
jgi:hypothetical protein